MLTRGPTADYFISDYRFKSAVFSVDYWIIGSILSACDDILRILSSSSKNKQWEQLARESVNLSLNLGMRF